MTGAITNRDSVAIMVTRDVSTYVSDSGVVRYKIITEEWKVFDRLDPSRWAFEKGIYLEKFDNKLDIDATIEADTAYYYDKEELWELRGDVHIENEQDEQFDTQLLFWNQKTKMVYSDQYIRIRQQKRIITGHGFTSNQNFTDYTIKQTQGIFPIKEEQTIATDSTATTTEESPRVEKKELLVVRTEMAQAQNPPKETTKQSIAIDKSQSINTKLHKINGSNIPESREPLKIKPDSLLHLQHQQ